MRLVTRVRVRGLTIPLSYRVYGVMFDSASQDFPDDSLLNAYYFNGHYAHIPYKVGQGAVWIDVLNNAPKSCSWLDVETGDATPADVPGWLDARNMPGDQGIYCSIDSVAAVNSYAAKRPFNLWVSTLDGNPFPIVPSISGTLVAVQCIPASMLRFNGDMSVVVNENYWKEHALAP
jgi:hypothetical protein